MTARVGWIEDIFAYFPKKFFCNSVIAFATQDADEKTDRDHWSKFPSFREYSDDMRLTRGPLDHRRNPHVFMRWKVRPPSGPSRVAFRKGSPAAPAVVVCRPPLSHHGAA